MVFIHSQHHACKESANSDVAACRRTPYRRGAAYPREVSRACDFRSHGLQTSILFLIPLSNLLAYPIARSSLLAKIEIGDYYIRQERGNFP